MATRLLYSRLPFRTAVSTASVPRSTSLTSASAFSSITTRPSARVLTTPTRTVTSSSTSASSFSSSSSSSSPFTIRKSPSSSLSFFRTALAIVTTTTTTFLVATSDSQAVTDTPVPPPQSASSAASVNSNSVNAPLSNEEIAAVVAAIHDLLDNDEEDGLGPTLVRLAWHASGTYDKESNSGGSEGATMRFEPEAGHVANAGLHVARIALEPIKKLFPRISYADLWTLAGAVAIEHMGGPKIVWRQGRRDATDASACPPEGRLPEADKGKVGATIRHIRAIFNRQGFGDREIVALVGAHALGRCHTDRSGYEGPWTRSPTTFSNQYFKELVENTWTLKNWNGPDQFEDPSGDLMMLPVDMALLWDKDFRKYVVEFARDEDKFFLAFANAFQKLEENGVPAFASSTSSKGGKPWYQFW